MTRLGEPVREGLLDAASRFVELLCAAQKKLNADTGNLFPDYFWLEAHGSRQWRVAGDDGVFCFIECSTGKIMKAESWRAPDRKRHDRGNVFHEDPIADLEIHAGRFYAVRSLR